MSEDSGNLFNAPSAVGISKSMFLTVAVTSPPERIGKFKVQTMKLATYTMGARNPVKILKELGYW